jgi:hypothetical protein
MLSVLLALAAVQQPVTLTLVADTTLDRKAPDANGGREPLLHGGVDKAVLLRFPDLGLTVGAGKRVKAAKLVMGLGRPGEPRLESVSRVTRPWGEGGDHLSQATATSGGATWRQAVAGRDGLDWERDGAAGGNDARAIQGVQTAFLNDVLTVSGLEQAVQAMVDDPQQNHGFKLVFSNAVAFFSADSLALGPQLVLEFEDGATSGPDLQLVLAEQTSAGSWEATVRNAGDAPATDAVLSVVLPGRDSADTKVAGTLAPGASATVAFVMPDVRGPIVQQRSVVLRVASSSAEKDPSDNGIVLYPHGLAVRVSGADHMAAQLAVQDLNERVFPFSKFGAWPTGCVERLRLVTREAAVTAENGENLARQILKAVVGLPEALLRPYREEPPVVAGVKAAGFVTDAGQVGLLPDTRDDMIIPRDLAIPDRTSTTGLFGDVPMNEWGMLSRSEVTIVNSQVGKPRALPWDMTPTAVFARVFTPDGVPPVGAKLDVYQMVGGAFGSTPIFSSQIERDGSALIPPREGGSFGKANPFGDLQKDGSNGWLLAVVRLNESVSSTWIPVWQLWDEYARGNQAAAFVELRVVLASGPLDTGVNLALSRLVADSKGRFPAELSVLVDDRADTSLSLGAEPDGYWLDIDLGRDRPLGQIQLVFDGPVWRQFRILTYKTAQSPSEAQVWSEESNGPANSEATKTEDGKTVLSYTSRSVRSRFVRLVPITREAVKLAEVRVVPIKGS